MINSREDVCATAKRIIAARPVLEPIIKAFENIFEARASLPKTLMPLVKKSKLQLPQLTEEYANQGRSLLSGMSLKGFDSVITASAKTMLPLLAKQEYLAPFIPTFELYFTPKRSVKADEDSAKVKKIKAPYKRYELAEAYIANDPKIIEKTAEALEVPQEALLFTFHFILAPALQALVLNSVPEILIQDETNLEMDPNEDAAVKKVQTPWDKNALWKEGYCPVCASFPSISYLDRALFDESNQFLSSGGGRKHLHCSLCGTNWHFKRGACPSCKEEGPDVIEILKEEKASQGERIDWCTKCKSYCNCVDLRINGKKPDFDMMALGLIHLDMIAHEKELTPLNPSFWNTF